MRELSVAADGGDIVLSAVAALYETRPEYRFHWTLKIYDKQTNEQIFHKDYNDQVFSLPPGEESRPTFTERIHALPGRFKVELVVHAFAHGFDLSQLGDREIEESVRILEKSKVIDVN